MDTRPTNVEYMFVVFSTELYRTATVGALAVPIPSSSADDTVLRKMWQDDQSPEQSAAHDQWRKDYEAFRNSVVSEQFSYVDSSAEQDRTVNKTRLTFPDGETTDHFAPQVDGVLLARFVSERGRQPPVEKAPYDDWIRSANPTIHEKVVWRCSAIHPDGSVEDLPCGKPTNPDSDALLGEMARVLNGFGSQGWMVVDSARDPDRQVRPNSDSSTTLRIECLLSRTTSSSPS